MTDAPGLVQRVLTDSVRHHLVSDVPIGVFLSGGIDSSSVAALVAENAPAGVHALTVSFEEAGFDESEVARDVAAHYGMKFTEVRITGADFLRDVPAWLTAQDMPSADGANSWIVSRACHDAGLTVALSGLGGDELFAGYYTFQATARARQLLRAAAWLPAAVRARAAAAVRVLGGRRTPTAKFADLLSTDGSLVSTYLIGRRMLWPTAIAPLVHPSVAALASPAALHPETLEDLRALSSDDDPTASVSVFEMSTYLLNTLLRDSDQMGMAHSVEIRVPFVDVDVVEQVSMLPGAVRTRGTGPKPLLCGAMGPRLKPAWTQRPKMTFSLPFDEWLRGPLRGEVGRGLARLAGFPFRADGVRRLWEAFLHGRGVNAPRILTLYSLSSWMERHRVDGGP
jgi:asparagine synthase (glutamine-hydrolysing)